MDLSDLDLVRMARAKAREGIASLEAATEFFPSDWDSAGHRDLMDLNEYNAKVAELRDWIFRESRIA